MIDVVIGKVFKDKMCDQWATWTLEESQKLGTTPAGNYKHPSYVDCLNWVVQAWKDFDKSGIKKKAKELGMTPELGPEIGYKHEKKRFKFSTWAIMRNLDLAKSIT